MKANKKFHFAHDFFKLQRQTTAKLLYVTQVSYQDLDQLSVVMDTQYYKKEQVPDRPVGTMTEVLKEYPLPKGALIMFIFLGNRGIPFTAYRQFSDASLRKYKERYEETFDIVVKKKEPDIQIKSDI